VFGCGGDRDAAKRPEMGRIAEALADIAIITNDNPRSESPERIVADIRRGLKAPDLFPVMLDRKAAIEAALQLAGPDDVVLIAGKGHEDYQLIGKQRFPFSDRTVVADWLELRR
jgi:UDP-N-acetylmuramoyl-L-alanyl-D-glutamate--2,6-diaminopimelate ligase